MCPISHGRVNFTKIVEVFTLFFGLFAFNVAAEPLARLEILSVSPRVVALSTTDAFDEVATGLNATPLGAKIYFKGEPVGDAKVNGYRWSITARPAGSTAQLSATGGEMVTYRPDKMGSYTISMVPLNANDQPTTETDQLFYAGNYAGVGTINTHATPLALCPPMRHRLLPWGQQCRGGLERAPRVAAITPCAQTREPYERRLWQPLCRLLPPLSYDRFR